MIESIILHSALNDRAKDGEVAGSVAVSCVVPRVDVFSVAEVRLIAKVAAFCLYSAGGFENGIHLLMVLSLIDLDDNLQRFLFLLSLFPGGTSEHLKTSQPEDFCCRKPPCCSVLHRFHPSPPPL